MGASVLGRFYTSELADAEDSPGSIRAYIF